MFKKEDLVVLMYSDNTCYTRVVTLEEAEQKPRKSSGYFKVDPKKGEWRREYRFRTVTKKIGESMYMDHGCRYGVIGVYDRTKIEHLDSMVYDGREATSSQGSCVDDD